MTGLLPTPETLAVRLDDLERHISIQIDDLEKHLEGVIALNDKRYAETSAAQLAAVNAALAAQQSAVNAALVAADRAVLKAETASEKRFDAVNEFRGTLSDQQRTLMPRPETEILFAGVKRQIDDLAGQMADLAKQVSGIAIQSTSEKTGKADSWKDITIVLSVVAAALAVASRFIK